MIGLSIYFYFLQVINYRTSWDFLKSLFSVIINSFTNKPRRFTVFRLKLFIFSLFPYFSLFGCPHKIQKTKSFIGLDIGMMFSLLSLPKVETKAAIPILFGFPFYSSVNCMFKYKRSVRCLFASIESHFTFSRFALWLKDSSSGTLSASPLPTGCP